MFVGRCVSSLVLFGKKIRDMMGRYFPSPAANKLTSFSQRPQSLENWTLEHVSKCGLQPPPKEKGCWWGLKTKITQKDLFYTKAKILDPSIMQRIFWKKQVWEEKLLDLFYFWHFNLWNPNTLWEKYLPKKCYSEHLLEIFPRSCLLSVWSLPGRKHVENLCELSPH